jgi:hypothetical protein
MPEHGPTAAGASPAAISATEHKTAGLSSGEGCLHRSNYTGGCLGAWMGRFLSDYSLQDIQ